MSENGYQAGPLEQIGCKLLRSYGQVCEQEGLDTIDFSFINKCRRRYIFIAAIYGATSALASAVIGILAHSLFLHETHAIVHSPLSYHLCYWSLNAVVILAEIILLYKGALKTAHQIVTAAGTPLQGGVEGFLGDITRAALELPTRHHSGIRINPTKYANKKKLFLLGLLYKAKVMLSNAVAKLLASKILLRGGLRAWIDFIAVPITALWNAWVAHRIMTEVQLRAIGPKMIKHYATPMLQGKSPEFLEVLTRCTACSVTTSLSLHPNLLCLLSLTHPKSIIIDQLDSQHVLLQQLSALKASERILAAKFFCLASVADNRYRLKESDLLSQVLLTAEIKPNKELIERLQREFLHGHNVQRTLAKIAQA